MSGHGGHNRGRASFILKRRGRMQWTTHTKRGPRRVHRWEPWTGVLWHNELATVAARMDELKRAGGLYHYAIFHRGKQLTAGQVARSAAQPKEGGSR